MSAWFDDMLVIMAALYVVIGRPLCFIPMIYYLLFIFSRSNLRGRRTPPRGTFARMSECGVIL